MWQVCGRSNRQRPRSRGKLILGPWFAPREMGREVRQLAERYQAAGYSERLSLWLQHRDLRPALSRLEQGLSD